MTKTQELEERLATAYRAKAAMNDIANEERRARVAAEAERDALRKGLNDIDLPVTDQELIRLNNMCVGEDGEVKIWVKMLHLLVTHAIAFRATRKALGSQQ